MYSIKQIPTNAYKQLNFVDGAYYINWNFSEIMEDEKKFKNSAFVPTGRKIPTGTGTYYSNYVSNPKNKKPSIAEIKSIIFKEIDDKIKRNILSGLVWNGYNVWLSSENQKNYSDWYNLTKDNMNVLPLTAKFTKNNKTIYYEFSTHEEIASLYAEMVKHINKVINDGRKMKDSIDFSEYMEFLK